MGKKNIQVKREENQPFFFFSFFSYNISIFFFKKIPPFQLHSSSPQKQTILKCSCLEKLLPVPLNSISTELMIHSFSLAKIYFLCKMKKRFSYNLEHKCGQCGSEIRLHVLCSLISDLHCPQKLLVSSSVRKESSYHF